MPNWNWSIFGPASLISAAEAQLLHAAPSLIGDIVCQLEDRLATLLVSEWEQSIRGEAYRGEVVG